MRIGLIGRGRSANAAVVALGDATEIDLVLLEPDPRRAAILVPTLGVEVASVVGHVRELVDIVDGVVVCGDAAGDVVLCSRLMDEGIPVLLLSPGMPVEDLQSLGALSRSIGNDLAVFNVDRFDPGAATARRTLQALPSSLMPNGRRELSFDATLPGLQSSSGVGQLAGVVEWLPWLLDDVVVNVVPIPCSPQTASATSAVLAAGRLRFRRGDVVDVTVRFGAPSPVRHLEVGIPGTPTWLRHQQPSVAREPLGFRDTAAEARHAALLTFVDAVVGRRAFPMSVHDRLAGIALSQALTAVRTCHGTMGIPDPRDGHHRQRAGETCTCPAVREQPATPYGLPLTVR